ncbi:MAG: hypothetical protein AAB436_03570 [Patescibacteria group bacterium]
MSGEIFRELSEEQPPHSDPERLTMFDRLQNFMNSDVSEWSLPAKALGVVALIPVVIATGVVADMIDGIPLK